MPFVHGHARDTGWVVAHRRRPNAAESGQLPLPAMPEPRSRLRRVKLSPRDQDRLTIFTIAELARRRRARGHRLGHPEAIGLICDEMHEGARDGLSYEAVVELGGRVLTREDVMDGVAEMIPLLHLEVMFADGTKLVAIRNPIR